MFNKMDTKEYEELDLPNDFPIRIRIPSNDKVELRLPKWTNAAKNGFKYGKIGYNLFQDFDLQNKNVQNDLPGQNKLFKDLKRNSKIKKHEDKVDLSEVLKEYKDKKKVDNN